MGTEIPAAELPPRELELCQELLDLLDPRYGVKDGPCQIVLSYDGDNLLQWLRPSPTVHRSKLGTESSTD
jgi:hypothetical protein